MNTIAHDAATSTTANVARSVKVEIVATPIASTNVIANAPSSFRSSLSRRNSPWGMRSTFTCIAKSTRDVTIAAAPMRALPVARRRVWNLWMASSVANRESRLAWTAGSR